MRRGFLYAKIHRMIVTDADLEYEGSITLDQTLMEEAGLRPYQQVDVYNVTRGTRLTTYAIVGPPGAGDCCLNGAAAHLAEVGDRVIVAAYCELEDEEVAGHRPRIVLVGEDNRTYTVTEGRCVLDRSPAAQGVRQATR
jgi:aspartate 1-decarboxylase